MFKKFNPENDISSRSKVKTSVQRNIRNKILEQYPMLEDYAEDLLPRKSAMIVAKCHEHIMIVVCKDEPLFFNQRDGPFFPTLKLLHKLPKLLNRVTVDKGAIPFVLSGANVMTPGLTSTGGDIEASLKAKTPVAIMAEGKPVPMAIGVLNMSGEEILEAKKGIAIDLAHFLGDDLWKLESI